MRVNDVAGLSSTIIPPIQTARLIIRRTSSDGKLPVLVVDDDEATGFDPKLLGKPWLDEDTQEVSLDMPNPAGERRQLVASERNRDPEGQVASDHLYQPLNRY